MEREQYQLMFRQEERHWWYVGMRRISAALLDRYPPAEAGGCPDILDAGCGSGGMTQFLARRGQVTGIDLAHDALSLARRRGVRRLVRASVGLLPLAANSFDVVTSFDVLYHLDVEDDVAALAELQRVLRPGGVLLIRLPAFDWIRGAHDQAVHTRHRYTKGELTRKLRDVGFLVEHASYANSLLFPLAPAKRLLETTNGPVSSPRVADLWHPPEPLNRLLVDLLSLEARAVSAMPLPWGLSVFAVGRKRS